MHKMQLCITLLCEKIANVFIPSKGSFLNSGKASTVVFLKNQCYDQIFAKSSNSLSKKHQYFCKKIWRKFFKNHNIGPRYYLIKRQKIPTYLLAYNLYMYVVDVMITIFCDF
jgi:hypothetical protein